MFNNRDLYYYREYKTSNIKLTTSVAAFGSNTCINSMRHCMEQSPDFPHLEFITILLVYQPKLSWRLRDFRWSTNFFSYHRNLSIILRSKLFANQSYKIFHLRNPFFVHDIWQGVQLCWYFLHIGILEGILMIFSGSISSNIHAYLPSQLLT